MPEELKFWWILRDHPILCALRLSQSHKGKVRPFWQALQAILRSFGDFGVPFDTYMYGGVYVDGLRAFSESQCRSLIALRSCWDADPALSNDV